MKHTTFLSIILFAAVNLYGQQNQYKVLPWNQSTAYNSYLTRMMHQQYRERDADFTKATQSKVAVEQYISDTRKRYQNIAGSFSAKGNLNAQTVATQETENLRIESIIFESVAGRFVTCNLYLPKKINGKIPAAIELCGHGINGKIPSRVAPLLALNGIAALVIDPIGQGERLQLIDNESNALTRGATTEHTLLNTSLNLLGTSLAAQEFFDNSRAIDYLLTRSEIDADNLAVYGSSGGGTQTTYYVGLDPRVKVATICSFFSQRERTFELQGASD
ncbi:MAG: acetylxylan esterase, partial [Paludibacter sp.]|nr:acetylxylan esterase [Paludibacter sp.]